MLEVVSRDERMAETMSEAGSGVYRLLFRVLASHPDEMRSFFEDTVAPVVRYDDRYHTDLLATLEAYLAQECNMNATARAIYAHRHTVAYRLERIQQLTGLDPTASEDRERLSLGLKAYRIVAPSLASLADPPGADRSGSVGNSHHADLGGAGGAAEDPVTGLDPVTDDPAAAVHTRRREGVYRALEAVEDVAFAVERDLHGAVVVVFADLAYGHASSSVVGR